MKRRAAVAGAFLTAAALVVSASTATSSPAAGVDPATGTANAQSLHVNTVGRLTVNTTSTNGLDTTGLNTLVNNLLQFPLSLTSGLANGVTTLTGTQASNPATEQQRPAAGTFPGSCSGQGWDSSDCFNYSVPTINVPGVASLSLGTLQGYATGDRDGYVAGAGVATSDISLLGGLLDLGSLGVITSLAQCPNTTSPASTCTPNGNLTGGMLLNNQVKLQVASSGGNSLLSAQVLQSGSWIDIGNLALPVAGSLATVAVNNNLLTIKLGLSVDQLLGLFTTSLTGIVGQTLNSVLGGLSSVLSRLLGGLLGGVGLDTSASKIGLTVTLGPGQTTFNRTGASAWGLDLNVGLNATIGFKVIGLLGFPGGSITTTASGSLLDLELAYSSATPGTSVPTWIAPGAI